MSELLIDILNEDGSKTGKLADINEIHNKGLWHKSSHLWIVNCKNQILLQKRSAKIINKPNLWHISSSGHVDSGEDSLDAIMREAKEEIGIELNPTDLILIKSFKDYNNDSFSTRINNEFVDVYLLIRDLNINDLHLNLDEVSEVKFVELSDFRNMVREREANLAPLWIKFEFIINYLETNRILVEKSCRLQSNSLVM